MSVLAQMEQLRLKHPRVALLYVNCQNSEFVNYSGNCKNCYLLIGSEYDQDCYYGYFLYNSEDCVDCDYCFYCRICYDCVDCHECYECQSCQDCWTSRNLKHCYDLRGSNDCFGCVGLRKAEYHIFNKKYKKEEYEEKLKEVEKLSHEEIEQRVEALKRETPRLMLRGDQNENAFGDYLYQSKDCYHCFDTTKLRDCCYLNNCEEINDSLDCSNNYYKSELNYEVMSAMNITNCDFCYAVFDSYDLEYCENVYNSHHCFGCFSLNHAEYCIFNTPYSPEEYEAKVTELKAQMKRDGEYGKHLPSTYPENF